MDEIIASAGTTKGGFFHHFPTKQALARGLVERYVADDMELLEALMARAERLSDDPLQQLLLFVGCRRSSSTSSARRPAACTPPSCTSWTSSTRRRTN